MHQYDTLSQAMYSNGTPAGETVDTMWRVPLTAPVDSVCDTTPKSLHLSACYDSVFAPYAQQDITVRESLFSANEHTSQETVPKVCEREHNPEWVFATFVILFIALSIYLNSRKIRIVQLLQSMFERRTLDRVFRENNLGPSAFWITTSIYITALSLILYKAMLPYGFMSVLTPILQFLVILVVLSLFVILKGGMIRLLGVIFEDVNATNLYISNNNVFYFAGVLIILPLSLLSFYAPAEHNAFVNMTYIATAIVFVSRIVRGLFLILTNSKTSKLYLFCYLCIFEVIPPLLAVKAVIM